MQNDILISICVIAYNSSEFIIETLESAKNQTYHNLELIISDDCSSDNTVSICKEWISKNSGRFVRAEIVTTPMNTGIAGNLNRALKACRGEWIKFIAGDDLLLPNAVNSYLVFLGNRDISHVIARNESFNEKGVINNDEERDFTRYMCREGVTVKEQYSVITKMFFGDGPTYFAKRSSLAEVGGYDERFPLQDDYPLYIRMIKAGCRLYYMDEVTVRYRVRSNSVSHTSCSDSFFPSNYVRIIKDYRFIYRKENSNPFWKLMHSISLLLCDNVIRTGNNKKSIRCRFAYMLYKLFDPYCWYARYMYNKMRRNGDAKNVKQK